MMIFGVFAVVFVSLGLASAQEIDDKLLQCLICRTAIEEVETVLEEINPAKTIDEGSYRLDPSGNLIRKKIPLRRSEVHISEVLDNICEKMSDYARARYKSNGRLTLIKLMGAGGHLNPEMSNVDIVQDGDLNKSLKYHCDDIVQEHEDSLIEFFRKGESNIPNKICTVEGNYCEDELPPDDEVEETEEDTERDEL